MRGTICRTEHEERADARRNPKQPEAWTIKKLPPTTDDLTVGAVFERMSFIATLIQGNWPTGLHAQYKGECYTVEGKGIVRDETGKLYRYGARPGKAYAREEIKETKA